MKRFQLSLVVVGYLMFSWSHSQALPLQSSKNAKEKTFDDSEILFYGDTDKMHRENLSHVVKREATSTEAKDQKKDLKAAATGYNNGAHGSYLPTSYVSYGARTGGYGAFSWYSDHPAGGSYGYH